MAAKVITLIAEVVNLIAEYTRTAVGGSHTRLAPWHAPTHPLRMHTLEGSFFVLSASNACQVQGLSTPFFAKAIIHTQ